MNWSTYVESWAKNDNPYIIIWMKLKNNVCLFAPFACLCGQIERKTKTYTHYVDSIVLFICFPLTIKIDVVFDNYLCML